MLANGFVSCDCPDSGEGVLFCLTSPQAIADSMLHECRGKFPVGSSSTPTLEKFADRISAQLHVHVHAFCEVVRTKLNAVRVLLFSGGWVVLP
mgnify:CR=1 FL=1